MELFSGNVPLFSTTIKCFQVISVLIMLKQFLFLSRRVHCEINISIKNISDAKPYITKKRENNVSLWSSGSMCSFKIGWLFTKKLFLSRTWQWTDFAKGASTLFIDKRSLSSFAAANLKLCSHMPIHTEEVTAISGTSLCQLVSDTGSP